jgi:hypothetical protein
LVFAFTLWGCGGSDDDGERNGATTGLDEATIQSFEGTYRLDTFTENPTSCDAEGPSTLSTLSETNFVLVGGEVFGQRYLELISCSDVADCQTKVTAVRSDGFYSADFNWTLSESAGPDELGGFLAWTGFEMDGICTEREYETQRLTRMADKLRVEARVYALEDRPVVDGFCEVRPAEQEQEAQGKPCSDFSVLTATKTGPLP